MSKRIIETYEYKNCKFKIYKEKGLYFAEYEEIKTYSDNLEELKDIKIPQKYYSCREFKL